MQTTEIQTSHNIVITFPLANLMHRLLANIIDIFLLVVFTSIMASIGSGTGAIIWIIIAPIIIFYHLLFEIFNKGQSIGKKLMKLRVIDVQGKTPSIDRYFMRWVFRMIDVTFSAGILASIFIVSTEQKQRLGDILAQTLVVSLKNENFVTLESIENLDFKDVEIKYPEVVKYSDTDMLLVKQSINRYTSYQNQEVTHLIDALTEKIISGTNIKKMEKTNLEFLKRILYEYIVLTR